MALPRWLSSQKQPKRVIERASPAFGPHRIEDGGDAETFAVWSDGGDYAWPFGQESLFNQRAFFKHTRALPE